jgi:hypothetical protein
MKMLFAGYEASDEGLLAVLYDLDLPADNAERTWRFDAKVIEKKLRAPVGTMFEIARGEKPNTLLIGSAKYVGDHETANALRLNALMVKREYEGKRALAKARFETLQMLEPIRQQYRKSIGAHRAHLLAAVVQYITSGRDS